MSSQRSPRTPRRPPYPALPTTSSHSAFQNSNTSISSAASNASSSSYASLSSQIPTSPQQSAPLPSPTTAQEPFFNALPTSADQLAALQKYQYQQQQAQQAYQQQMMLQAQATQQAQNQAYGQHGQAGHAYPTDRTDAGATRQETNAFIDQYGLVAEAAKRAQMAVLERDLGGVELG